MMKIWLDGDGLQIPPQGLPDSAELPLGLLHVVEWREHTVSLRAVPPAKKYGLSKLVCWFASAHLSLSPLLLQ